MNIKDIIKKAKKIIHKKDAVFITSHKDLDLDAIASMITIYQLLESYHKKLYLIIDDQKHESAVNAILNNYHNQLSIINNLNIDISQVQEKLLIIVDTNKEELLQSETILSKFQDIIVLDHHEVTSDTLKSSYQIINIHRSSTSEMLTSYIKDNKIKISSDTATILLGGIVVDTNNFILRTTFNTYELAGFLTRMGANPTYVQNILKQDINEYIEHQKVIIDAKIINNHIAVSKGLKKEIYRREELAKIADVLLLFQHIEASFVVAYVAKDTVGISVRSMGSIPIQPIINHFNGGGNNYTAAARINNASLNEVYLELENEIKNNL